MFKTKKDLTVLWRFAISTHLMRQRFLSKMKVEKTKGGNAYANNF